MERKKSPFGEASPELAAMTADLVREAERMFGPLPTGPRQARDEKPSVRVIPAPIETSLMLSRLCPGVLVAGVRMRSRHCASGAQGNRHFMGFEPVCIKCREGENLVEARDRRLPPRPSRPVQPPPLPIASAEAVKIEQLDMDELLRRECARLAEPGPLPNRFESDRVPGAAKVVFYLGSHLMSGVREVQCLVTTTAGRTNYTIEIPDDKR